jgi:hypothetical protein
MIVQGFRVASLLKSNGNRAVVNVNQHGTADEEECSK